MHVIFGMNISSEQFYSWLLAIFIAAFLILVFTRCMHLTSTDWKPSASLSSTGLSIHDCNMCRNLCQWDLCSRALSSCSVDSEICIVLVVMHKHAKILSTSSTFSSCSLSNDKICAHNFSNTMWLWRFNDHRVYFTPNCLQVVVRSMSESSLALDVTSLNVLFNWFKSIYENIL